MGFETLFITTVGSHVWGMNTPKSDIDYYKCYIAPSEDFLIGMTHMRGHEKQSDDEDTSSFEIGHIIKQLKNGNLNHIIGVKSNLVVEKSQVLLDLQDILDTNMGKNCYRSIRGMAAHNYKRYFEDNCRGDLGPDAYKKKLGQVGRVIEFGIRILNDEGILFKPCYPESRYDIEQMINRLDKAYEDSILPDYPDNDIYDRYLLNLRLNKLRK